ncbi:CDP-alcohol phosphatidyltransferase family protein [Bifidobacterium criceti]|uniref:CDP-diacylglycerol--glycerol-3-phosphate 3-phosphatidyltransferase n=1 Tax=Bifidobacterium criceti TaxID=1960969 RepID=A0A2A2EEH1_9BIFI|nr:CDP-alcohol phosphatidyltransferase family protein [Bifidobacterium criceti]PAU67336.1 CDP-diacylglycerol--glycerol-3-phosphate 3-phosphatidyltransferase [Bifidobacterium criceti]
MADAGKYSPEPRDMVFTIPNLISALRIVSIPVIAWFIARHDMVWALVILAVSSASDGLDGIIARNFNQVSKLGQILDPIADRLLIICSILALAVCGVVPWWMLALVALRDIVMGILTLMLAQHDYGPLPVHFVGKTGTAILLISIIGLMVADIRRSFIVLDVLHYGAIACAIWGIGLYWLAGIIYLRQGIGLIRADSTRRKAVSR